MSTSFTLSGTQSFSVTHAKHLASKVATDLKRIQRFYGTPNDTRIAQFESELVEYLKAGYLYKVSYGFQKDGAWIEPTLQYTTKDLAGMQGTDDDPGRVKPGADVSGATFYSYLEQNSAYDALTAAQKEAFWKTLPFTRTGAAAPGVSGYLMQDKSYSSGGRALDRSYVKSD